MYPEGSCSAKPVCVQELADQCKSEEQLRGCEGGTVYTRGCAVGGAYATGATPPIAATDAGEDGGD